MRADLVQRTVVLAVIIIAVVALLLRAWRPALAVLTPPAVAVLWTFGLMGWLGVELTPFTVLVAAFVGGIGIDCAVFLAHGEDRERLAAPVIACIGTAVAGAAALIGARHPLLAGVGLTLTIGMLSCLGACLLLTPGIAGRPPAR
jgi:predicted RND superfamily exporter protein